jgi:hypothetical protein
MVATARVKEMSFTLRPSALATRFGKFANDAWRDVADDRAVAPIDVTTTSASMDSSVAVTGLIQPTLTLSSVARAVVSMVGASSEVTDVDEESKPRVTTKLASTSARARRAVAACTLQLVSEAQMMACRAVVSCDVVMPGGNSVERLVFCVNVTSSVWPGTRSAPAASSSCVMTCTGLSEAARLVEKVTTVLVTRAFGGKGGGGGGEGGGRSGVPEGTRGGGGGGMKLSQRASRSVRPLTASCAVEPGRTPISSPQPAEAPPTADEAPSSESLLASIVNG